MQEIEEVVASMLACSHMGGLKEINRRVFENLLGDFSSVWESFILL